MTGGAARLAVWASAIPAIVTATHTGASSIATGPAVICSPNHSTPLTRPTSGSTSSTTASAGVARRPRCSAFWLRRNDAGPSTHTA